MLSSAGIVACSLRDLSSLDTLPDGSVAADGGGGTDGAFCATIGADAAFCDDFDTPPLGATWSSIHADGGYGVFALDDAAASPPWSAELGVLANDGGVTTGEEVQLDWKSPDVVHRITVRADIRIDAINDFVLVYGFNFGNGASFNITLCPGHTCGKEGKSGHALEVFQTDITTCNANPYAYFNGAPDASAYCFSEVSLTHVPSLGTWSTVTTDFSFDSHTVVVTIDGQSSLPTALDVNGWVPSKATLLFGPGYMPAPNPQRVALFDNVRIDVQ